MQVMALKGQALSSCRKIWDDMGWAGTVCAQISSICSLILTQHLENFPCEDG